MSDVGLRMMGKDPEGDARGVEVTDQGAVKTQLTGSKVQPFYYDKENPGLGREGDYFEIRDTGDKTFNFPHGGKDGSFQQIVFMEDRHDAPIQYLRVTLSFEDVGLPQHFPPRQYYETNLPEGVNRILFTPEKGVNAVDYDSGQNKLKIIEIPELRLPFSRLIIAYSFSTAPTEGEVKFWGVKQW